MTVTSAKNSPFFHREDPSVSRAERQGASGGNTTTQGEGGFTTEQAEDNLDFSAEARQVLLKTEKELHSILQESPEFQQMFLMGQKLPSQGSALSQAITLITKAKSFLQDPFLQSFAQTNAPFGAFYEEVRLLTKESEEALQVLQQSKRQGSQATYHGLV